MPRSRNIKPGIMVNEDLAELPMGTRLLFIYLWMLADRAGRLEDRPKRIKVETFPYDDVDVDGALNELAEVGMVRRYQVGQTNYIQIVNFEKHQSPHCNEKASTLPAPDKYRTSTVQEPEQYDTTRPDSLIPDSHDCGLKKKSSEQSSSPVVSSFLLVDGTEYLVTQAKRDEYRDSYPRVDVDSVLRRIRQWCRDNPQKRKTRRGALKFLNSWMAREAEKAREPGTVDDPRDYAL